MTRWRSTASTSTVRRVSRRLFRTSPRWTTTTPGRTPTSGTSRRPSGRSRIPVIGSLNGTSKGGWVRYGRLIQEAGADALELNVYDVVTDPHLTGRRRRIALHRAASRRFARSSRSPSPSSWGRSSARYPTWCSASTQAGANGLVLFNRFLQPDIDLETLRVAPNLVLSTSSELRLPLRWIAILRAHFDTSLAATTGVHTARDAIKLLLAGADVTMIASALYQHGPNHVRTLLDGIRAWMVEKEYASVTQMKGSLSLINAPDPAAFERANYIKTLVNFTGTEATT